MNRLAYFISPHGFGHAARAAAVMQAVSELDDSVYFDIFTTVPSWFFQDSLSVPFTYHKLVTDIGLVQKTSFQADLNATLRRLSEFLPFQASCIKEIAAAVKKLNCALIICDISPMGLAVGKQAGIPTVLVENFTWDWIYRQYADLAGRFNEHIDYLKTLFTGAQYHVKTEPVCSVGPVDLTTAPVSRKIKNPAARIRKRLGLPAASKMVLITTGGIKQRYGFLDKLRKVRRIDFVLPGAGLQIAIRDNLIILPARSDFYHPDLVNASDAVVGKVGYSTLAEVYHAGVPFGYAVRSNFRESEPMVDFIEREINGIFLDESEFSLGEWTAKLNDLLDMGRVPRNAPNGADQVGRFITGLIQ
jgi:UDP-N-acetylglucosamine:LPS N-acetylglucosamine transferase